MKISFNKRSAVSPHPEFMKVVENHDFDKTGLVRGYGEYIKKTGTAHHAKIWIEVSKNPGLMGNTLSWEVADDQIPTYFLDCILNTIKATMPETLGLNFRIVNGEHHVVDSWNRSFEIATFLALMDCFNFSLTSNEQS